ncbi:MAG: hypothetical protein HYV63_02395 [Candidatus Schekmanbacteria bacterium]|nr:hypothetical protein [Candidatus Schekmanbacteria bacterium]
MSSSGPAICALLVTVGFCASCGTGGRSVSGAAIPEVDLDALLREFQSFNRGGAKDPQAFCDSVVQRGIYSGEAALACQEEHTGALVGYVDADAIPGFDNDQDSLVFRLEVEPDRSGRGGYLIASDRDHYHRRSLLGDVATFYLISRMFDNHRGFYGSGYRHSYSYAPAGYYQSIRSQRTLRNNTSSWQRSLRSGSRNSRTGWGGYSAGGLRRGK